MDMSDKNTTLILSAAFLGLMLLSGCSENYPAVKAGKCAEIVQHTSKVLGKLNSKTKPEMLKECKNYSDEQRGCAMQAKIVADLVKCAKI